MVVYYLWTFVMTCYILCILFVFYLFLFSCAYDICFFFFFQAEDGIRDYKVTGVQTCALPICVKQLVINRCVNCHGPVNFVSRRFDRLGWKKVVIDMGRIEEIGPPNYKSISDEEAMASKNEEAERITAYLVRHFGPDKAPGLNEPKTVAYRNTVGEPDVVITQFDIPTRTAIPHNLTVDPRGHDWFVERYGEKIGGLDPKTG